MTEYMNVIIHSVKEWVNTKLGSYVQKGDVDGKLVPPLSADGSDAGKTIVVDETGTSYELVTDNSSERIDSVVSELGAFKEKVSDDLGTMQADVDADLNTLKTTIAGDIATAKEQAIAEANNAANAVKNDLLSGAGEAYDTLRELGELIDENVDAIAALEAVATGKADKGHAHSWEELNDKPFGEETKEVVIIEDVPSFDGPVGGKTDGSMLSDDVLKVADIVIGDTYALAINDVNYYGVAEHQADPTSENGNGVKIHFYPNRDMTGEAVIGFGSYSNDIYSSIIVDIDIQRPWVIKFIHIAETTKQLDEQYIPSSIARTTDLDNKLDKNNPTGTGSFSMNRRTEMSVGDYSHVEGMYNYASGYASHAEGYGTAASNYVAHAEGYGTTASGYESHAEGEYSTASGSYSHAEGYQTTASGQCAHAEGDQTVASEYRSHAEGYYTEASGMMSHAEGYRAKAIGHTAHAEGYETKASGAKSHAEGEYTEATGDRSHAEGYESEAIGEASHAEGSYTKATENSAHAEGYSTEASGQYSHAEGSNTVASYYYAHAEGMGSKATKSAAHAEGKYTQATGEAAHAEGNYTEASGYCSHAEGQQAKATAEAAHAEGNYTEAQGPASHAENYQTIANGQYSHAQGLATTASGFTSHAEGCGTVAASSYTHVQGKYNIPDSDGVYQHIVGNGSNQDNLSNAHTLDWDGNAWYAGSLKVGGTSYEDASEVALKSDIAMSWDNLENKPFYEIDNTQVVLSVEDIVGSYDEGGDLAFASVRVDGLTFETGTVYHITGVVNGDAVDVYDTANNGQLYVDGFYQWLSSLRIKVNTQKTYVTFEMSGVRSFEIASLTISCGDVELVKLDEKFIPETIARTADVDAAIKAVAYSTNDYTDTRIRTHRHSWDDLNDKPFEEVVSELVLSVETDEGATGMSVTDFRTDDTNQIYTVEFDGVKYTGGFEIVTDVYGSEHSVLGNAAFACDMSDYINDIPFAFAYVDYRGAIVLYLGDDNTAPHTVSVYLGTGENGIKTIDEKFIPKSISRAEHKHTWDELEGKPFGEVTDWTLVIAEATYANNSMLGSWANTAYSQFRVVGTYRFTIDGTDEYVYEKTMSGVSFPVGDSSFANYPFCTEFRGNHYIKFQDGASHTLKVEFLTAMSKPIDAVYIPDTIARVTYVDDCMSAKADVDHVHAFADLQDKPFGEIAVQVEDDPSLTVALTTITASGQKVNGNIGIGARSIVRFDGKLYECDYVQQGEVPAMITYYGNLALCDAGDDNGLPFCLKRQDKYTYCYVADESTSHTVEAFVGRIDILRLGEKFISTAIARTADVDELRNDFDSHTHSWNDLNDKPFGEGDEPIEITWDGQILELEADDYIAYDTINALCHVSDFVPTNEQLMQGSLSIYQMGHTEDTAIADSLFVNDYGDIVDVDGCFYIVKKDNVTSTVPIHGYYLTFAKAGIYSAWSAYREIKDGVPVFYIPSITFPASVKTLDEKYIPDTIARVSDVSSKITTALSDYYTQAEVEVFHDEIKEYVDDEVAALVNAAPETLDTIGELAAAFEENKDVVEALDASITNKQDKISDTLILVDTVTGKQHKLQIQNGQLVSFPIEE